jgi:hypothetical protein
VHTAYILAHHRGPPVKPAAPLPRPNLCMSAPMNERIVWDRLPSRCPSSSCLPPQAALANEPLLTIPYSCPVNAFSNVSAKTSFWVYRHPEPVSVIRCTLDGLRRVAQRGYRKWLTRQLECDADRTPLVNKAKLFCLCTTSNSNTSELRSVAVLHTDKVHKRSPPPHSFTGGLATMTKIIATTSTALAFPPPPDSAFALSLLMIDLKCQSK